MTAMDFVLNPTVVGWLVLAAAVVMAMLYELTTTDPPTSTPVKGQTDDDRDR